MSDGFITPKLVADREVRRTASAWLESGLSRVFKMDFHPESSEGSTRSYVAPPSTHWILHCVQNVTNGPASYFENTPQ